MICPCNTLISYELCCGQVHKSIFNAKTAEELMRSRYTAFVYNLMDYLKSSHSNKTVKYFNFKETSHWTKSVSWIKLEIIETINGSEFDNEGYVEFKAFFKENGMIHCIHGKSRFLKQNNHWVYLDEIN